MSIPPDDRPATGPIEGYRLGPDESLPGRDAEVRCSAASTGGSLALYRSTVDGDGPPWHEHVHEDETIQVLEGELEVECGAERWRGGPGTTFFLPRGRPHTFRSIDGPAEILFIVTPGHLDEFFRLRETVSNPEEMAELMRRFL